MTWRVGGAVCIAFAVGYGAGTALDHWHPGTDDRYSEIIGRKIYEWGPWKKPPGLGFRPGGGMVLY